CTGNWRPPTPPALTVAPSSRGTVRLGRARVVGPTHQLRVPVYVRAAGTYQSLDVELRYDPAKLTIAGIRRVGAAQRALVAQNRRTPGLLKIALASSELLRSGAVFMLELDAHTTHVHSALAITRVQVGDAAF